jgi:aspartate aminotransferase-like enzyme
VRVGGRFFLPGPVEVRPDVLEAQRGPMVGLRSAAMHALLERMQPPLQRLFRTSRPVMIASCSATGLMEAAVTSAVRRRVLVIVNGYFGERFARVAEACGREVVRAVVPEGQVLEPHHLERFLDGPPIDAVALVHSETSTGALAPLEELARVVRSRPDTLLLVDAVTSIGGLPVETDAWGLDFVFAGSQKALALPPGLALGVASERLLARAATMRARGWYLDLLKFDEAARRHAPTQTPALSLLHALDHQLRCIDDEGGLAGRWMRHERLLAALESWAAAVPELALLAPPGRRSRTVSALRLPEGRSALALVARLDERGYTVAPGLGHLADAIVRVGHMGDVEVPQLEEMLGVLEEELRKM